MRNVVHCNQIQTHQKTQGEALLWVKILHLRWRGVYTPRTWKCNFLGFDIFRRKKDKMLPMALAMTHTFSSFLQKISAPNVRNFSIILGKCFYVEAA